MFLNSNYFKSGDCISATTLALSDIVEGFKLRDLWLLPGVEEIRMRYSKTFLGPFWITISTAIFVFLFSFVGSALFSSSLDDYLPYLASGLVIWTFFSSTVIESSSVLISNGMYLKQVKVPYSVYLYKLIVKNIIVLMHNAVVFGGVAIFLGLSFSTTNILEAAMGLVVITMFLFGLSLTLSVLSAKYRDIPEMVTSLMQVVFFLTPVIWKEELLRLKGKAIYVDTNPFYHLIAIVRNPLIGQDASLLSWIVSLSVTLLVLLLGVYVFIKARKRIVYYV